MPNSSKTNVCLTGCSGFIGSNLVERLHAQGFKVYGVDMERPRFPTSGLLEGFYQVDIVTNTTLPIWVKGCDIVIHLAANTDTLFHDDLKMVKENVNGFLWAASTAKFFKVPLVYATSSAIYGNGDGPLNAYALSKLLTEKMATQFNGYLKRSAGLRFFNVYGKHEGHKGRMASMIHQWGKALKAGEQPKLFDDSVRTMRDFIYVGDVCDAIIRAMDEDVSGIHDVGSGVQHNFTEVLQAVQKELGTNLEPEIIPNKNKETYQINTKAVLDWQWKPKVSLTEGIKLALS